MFLEKLHEKILGTVYSVQQEFSCLHGDIVIAHENKMLWQKCFSYKGAPSRLVSNKQMLVGSTTKQFTAVCLLKLLYERHAEFQKDVQNIMKDVERDLHMPISQLSFFNDEIFTDKTPGWINKITLHHLLTHTSGIQKETELNFSNNQIFEAGEKFLYTNPNYVLVGKLISNLISESVGSYLSKVIFKPLGMESTYLLSSGMPKEVCQKGIAKNLIYGYQYDSSVSFTNANENITFQELDVAGGAISNVTDLIKWNDALYCGKILPLDLINSLFAKGHIKKEASLLYDIFPESYYGYGINITHHLGRRLFYHCGGVPGYQSRLIYLPHLKISIVHLSNIEPDEEKYNYQINRIMNEKKCNKEEAEKLTVGVIPKYCEFQKLKKETFVFVNKICNALLQKDFTV